MSSDSEIDENISDQQSEQSENEQNGNEEIAEDEIESEAPVTWKDLVSSIEI